jgi:TAT-translocated FGD2 family F420-dependent dehydrogenase
MSRECRTTIRSTLSPDRRDLLRWTGALAGVSAAGIYPATRPAQAQPAQQPQRRAPQPAGAQQMNGLRKGMMSFMLAHEQFLPGELIQLGSMASRAGFGVLSTSDHFQPWQSNEGHAGLAWVTMAAMGAQAGQAWMGTTVTCPTLRYSPAVVAEAFSSLSHLYPGRIFLGVGSGEALNEQAATGAWPRWQERWDRLIEAMQIIRALWSGQPVQHKGQYYTVNARLYDPPAKPIPLLAAANGKKSLRLAGQHADGLISDPKAWKQYKPEWEAGARAAGKDPSTMPVLIEQYVVVGSQSEARQAAELWRFGPKAFKSYYNEPDPGRIQQRAEAEVRIEEVTEGWAVGTDPAVHLRKIHELRESGATIINIHSGQADQRKVIEFYGSQVLPRLKA